MVRKYPTVRKRIFKKPSFKELLGYFARRRGELEETLTEQKKELLYKMTDNRNELDSLAEAEVFEYGFRLGSMHMVSISAEKKNAIFASH